MASSLPPGSVKWNLCPPGKENISLVMVAPSFMASCMVASKFLE